MPISISVADSEFDEAGLNDLKARYEAVRRRTEQLAEPLPVEDQVIQSMAEVSPTKWHLGHTAWFFETFVAGEFCEGYEPFRPQFDYLFNSYYIGAGPQFERSRRGTIGRPEVETILDYREYVDEAVLELFDGKDGIEQWAPIIEVGLHHEQQHQELILTDIKHVLANNPLRPAYRDDCAQRFDDHHCESIPPVDWVDVSGGIDSIGHDGEGFAFDNEQPRHQVFVEDFRIADRPVVCGEFMEFIDDGGYEQPDWWLSEGWETVCQQNWGCPLYWQRRDGRWWLTTLGGMRPVDPFEPVCHVSYYEADAFARWAGARLPTEAEWEIASRCQQVEGNFCDTERLHPKAVVPKDEPDNSRFFGDVWEWTSSSYGPYPGFEPWDDTLGEYNGKFMCNQYVLRGGSCASPSDHLRRTYRNFFHPDARWQFTGFRLATSTHSMGN